MPEIRIALTAGEAARANRHWTDEEHAAWWLRNIVECDRHAARWQRRLMGMALAAVGLVLMIAGLL